jgi:hypothetical protein
MYRCGCVLVGGILGLLLYDFDVVSWDGLNRCGLVDREVELQQFST